MEGIKDKVAIIGMGCTKFGENWDMSLTDMVVDAAYEAFEDAGIEPKDVQAAWLGTYMSGLSGQTLAKPLKLSYIPITRVENMCATGSDAIRNAAYAVAAGVCDIALALGVEKLKDNGYSGLPDTELMQGLNFSENTYRSRTFTAPGHFAMMATAYFSKYGLSPEEGKKTLAMIEVKNHHNGSLHPKAHFQQEVTLETVLNAPIIAWPLGLFDCCGVSDGAAAAIVTRKDLAKNFRSDPVYIKALQIAVGPQEGYISTEYDWSYVEETFRAGQVAYQEAGIKNPRQEISIAEVHDCFSITEMVIYEDLQFSSRGRAKDDIEAGFFNLDGALPVNTDGGLKCFGHPIGASGLRMMYEVYKQLQGKGGPRQIKNPTLGLTHNLGGTPGSATISVLIVGN
ncbi:MAG: acetyl-CoA acetyltransferase [Proteobacteria bacterium]|nr:acetyl-CoA acetyltransferase [Pseudomonadota bacterium]